MQLLLPYFSLFNRKINIYLFFNIITSSYSISFSLRLFTKFKNYLNSLLLCFYSTNNLDIKKKGSKTILHILRDEIFLRYFRYMQLDIFKRFNQMRVQILIILNISAYIRTYVSIHMKY